MRDRTKTRNSGGMDRNNGGNRSNNNNKFNKKRFK
jgi:hypothetical protein